LDINEMELDRAKAMDRAFLISKLFRREYFGEIIAAINATDTKTARAGVFAACEKAGLTEPQTKWLWNYLENYKGKELAWNQSTMNGW